MASGPTARASAGPLAFDGTRAIIVGGFVVGAVLGFGGNFVEQDNIQSVLFGLSAVGLILASVLLAVEHVSIGHRLAAAGFALLALGETRVLNPTDVPGGEASFAAGVLLYAPGLLMIALSGWAPAGFASLERWRPSRSRLILWSTWAGERSTARVPSRVSDTRSSP
ncbi:MAG: hypothetical protein ACRDIX_02770 [Actinomycetota bacterium]